MKAVRLAWAILLMSPAAPAADFVDCHLVPGWAQQGAERSYEAHNLFEYMDGSAEEYLLYGFVRLQSVTCAAGEDSIVIDVSEMADADAAYGIFAAHHDPRAPVGSIGMGGQILPGRATFSKDKYYVEIVAHPEKDHSAVLRAFVAEIEKRIPGRSDPPEALAWFPTEGLVSLRLIPESVLGIRVLKRGYVAEYEGGKAFVVAEESASSAAAVLGKLRERFASAAPAEVAEEAFQAEDRYLGGLCAFRKGRYVAGYANLPRGQDATELAAALAARIP